MKTLNTFALALVLMGACAQALASTPAEKIVCTSAPSAQWMSEAQARELFRAATYVLVKFKISRGNCYEFYAIDHDGSVVEAYLNPVNGQLLRNTRLPNPDHKQPVSGHSK